MFVNIEKSIAPSRDFEITCFWSNNLMVLIILLVVFWQVRPPRAVFSILCRVVSRLCRPTFACGHLRSWYWDRAITFFSVVVESGYEVAGRGILHIHLDVEVWSFWRSSPRWASSCLSIRGSNSSSMLHSSFKIRLSCTLKSCTCCFFLLWPELS